MSTFQSLEPMNVTLHGRDFANGIMLRTLKWANYPGSSRWAVNAITSVFIQGRHVEIMTEEKPVYTQKHR